MIIKITNTIKLRIARPLWFEIDGRSQLELSLPHTVNDIKIPSVPVGFQLRKFELGDAEKLRRLFSRAGFEFSSLTLNEILAACLPGGCFVIEDQSDKKLVATMMARHHSSADYPFGGRIDWLATDPGFRGKGFGNICARSAARHLITLGYENIWVTTDDERIHALKIFLSMGFEPVIIEKTKGRWQIIYEKLNMQTK